MPCYTSDSDTNYWCSQSSRRCHSQTIIVAMWEVQLADRSWSGDCVGFHTNLDLYLQPELRFAFSSPHITNSKLTISIQSASYYSLCPSEMAKSSRTRQGTDKPRPVQRIKSSIPHFLQLPIEIFDMIIDYYYPEIPESVIIENHIGVNPKYGERGKVLRALSRTSQALRNQCLSRAWEHIEACVLYPEDTHGVWYKQVSKRLENVSNGLTECPHLAPYVR